MHTRPSISIVTIELPLAIVSDNEVRSVIQFLRVCGEMAAEIRTLYIRLIWHHLTFIYSPVRMNISLARDSTQQRKSTKERTSLHCRNVFEQLRGRSDTSWMDHHW